MSGRGGAVGHKRDERERGFGGGGWSGHGEYMQHKEEKLAAQYAQSVPQQSDCLNGVVLHIDGVSSTRQLDLSDLIVAHGGKYMQYLHGGVTHLLANTLPAAKIAAVTAHLAEARRKGRHVFVVREAWLVESARFRQRLPEREFALPELHDPDQHTLSTFMQRPGNVTKESPVLRPSPSISFTSFLSPADEGVTPNITRAARNLNVGRFGLVLHADVDAYFVQCHQVEYPQLYPRNLALAVQQHQDIIAVNHLAKEAGVTKHMNPGDAALLLERVRGRLVHVPTDAVGRVTYRLYEKHSRRLFGLWRRVARQMLPEAVMEVRLRVEPRSAPHTVEVCSPARLDVCTYVGARIKHGGSLD